MFFKSLVFSKTKIGLGGFFFEKNPMTNKIKKFLYILEHLIPDGRDEIPTFALYHPLLPMDHFSSSLLRKDIFNVLVVQFSLSSSV